MRLHRLELTGFGPFRERQTVDFEAFERDGIFLIAGRTGAGKSSILDGVCFALYGSVPRYDTSEKRLRSDYCEPDEPTEVRLEFTVGEHRWRVTRAPEYQRPARRGGGLTTEPTRAELEELVDGEWIGRAARPRDVGLLLDEVLGLNAQQFQQVILLAQNKFSRFLLASGTERQSLLRALFGTRRYEEYARELGDRSKAAQREVDALGERARTLLEQAERLLPALDADDESGGVTAADGAATDAAGAGSAGATAADGTDAGGLTRDGKGDAVASAGDLAARRAAVELGEKRAAYRLDTRVREREDAERARAAADAEHAARVALAKSQAELVRARERLAALEDDTERIDAERGQLDRARAAESLRAPLDAVRRAGASADTAHEIARAAEAAWRAAAQAAGVEAEQDLEALIDRVTGDLAVWAAAAAKETELAAREDELAAATARAAELERDIVALEAQREHIPGELARLDDELVRVRDDAARAEGARERRTEVASRLAAAREAEKLAAVLREAEAAHRDAAMTAATAGAAVAELLQRRLDGYAGELAATLVDGEPCAVCGAVDHPHPAVAAAEPVTDHDLTAAEARREAAIERERIAADAARAARERHAAAAARSGGDTVATLEEQLAGADAQLVVATDAAARRDTLAAQREQLATLDAEAEAARTSLVDALTDQRTRVAALSAGIEESRAAVAEARGPFPSVAERLGEATALRDAARACAQARDDAGRADAALAQAAADVEARVAASVFDDATDAAAAVLAPREVDELAARIAEHDAQLAATRGRLLELELELAGTPDEPVDLAASQTALDAADAARTAALEAERDARHLAGALRDLALQIDGAFAGVAERAADVAALTRLADTVAGRAPNTMKMDLETFVLAAELEEIVAAANVRLADMSSGRYRLQHTDARAARGAASGLGLEVFDAYTGQSRPAQSLSGGETFLASLALALGLAEVVTARAGGVRLDTLFIDEGFGSLDEETLELAMRTLDELRAGGRTVGVISHVAAMKEQLPAQLRVEAAVHGPSVVRQFAVV